MTLCAQCGTPNDDDCRFCMHCGASMEESRADPLIGRTVGGAYLLQELVGVGGMGRVYKAEQNMLGRTVAVKVIHPHLLGDDQTVARFYNEARAASRLNHPDSVGIIDFGRTEDGILYLVMEYLAGKDLAHILADEGPLPFPRICRIMRHIISALGEAHALGVVHRDLKPENVIVRKVRRGSEQVKVVDFGLAHIVGPGGTSITTPGLVCGTPDYMSPEQGRGEPVDGRGDLYSCGVVLYEMLTDRLPFEDDTPTKVVFKHIHDPVPDPREEAPGRQIPDSLALICVKSLAKKAGDRFQSADEFYEAIRLVERELDSAKTSVAVCGSCGAGNPMGQSFCGSCGARVADRVPAPGALTAPPGPRRSTLPTAGDLPLVGRDLELERLLELRSLTDRRSVRVRVVGEAGAGKTRLLTHLAQRVEDAGDRVVLGSAHPSGAPVPYWAVRSLLMGLLDVDEAGLRALIDSDSIGDPIARAGLREVLEPVGLPGRSGEDRSEAVTIALAAATYVAAGTASSGRVTLIVDDLSRCDALTAKVLGRLIARLPDGPAFLVTSHTGASQRVADDDITLLLRGLELPEAERLLAGLPSLTGPDVDRDAPTEPAGRILLPLYIEQLRALGIDKIEGDDTIPTRLADAVQARLERLDMSCRRLLQVLSVVGDEVMIEWVRELARAEDMAALETLAADGLVSVESDRISLCHPFVRELVEASIPAEHRKELHAAAFQVAAGHDAPLEVRARHAFRAGEPMSALLLLERMGDRAIARGDGAAAVLAFRRGLDVARRELLLTGETALDRAIVTFSRKLGDALDRAGDTTGADGVLREALELAGPADKERPRMLLVLSRVATARNRHRDATRFLGQALELCVEQKNSRGEAAAHLALGRLRLEDGDALTAANTLQKAIDLATRTDGEGALVVEARLVRAEALTAVGDKAGAQGELEHAREIAQTNGASAMLPTVLARLAETLPDPDRSQLRRQAATLAAEAGDADSVRRWSEPPPPMP